MRGIHQWLACEESGRPFSHCIHCKLPLLEIAEPWLVNKDYHRDECVIEYAICQPCRDLTTARISEESKEAVRNFLETEIDWTERQKEYMMMYDEVGRFDSCVACRKSRKECDGFALSALYDAEGRLVTGPLPLLICHDCVGRIVSSLSDESREVWRRFLAEHFAGPPHGEFDVSDGGFGMF